MGKLRLDLGVSLDMYLAGPNQSLENALGERGELLHEWMYPLEAFNRAHGEEGGVTNENSPFVENMFEGVGACIMGRNMFGGGPGPWGDEPWEGWWGDEPPYHCPVFVVTNYDREPLVKGETTFHFVTDGIESALERAREAAGQLDVSINGGANTVNQYLAAGLVDELILHIAPVFLGAGERLFEDLGPNLPQLEQTEATGGPGVTHIRYRVAG